MESFTIKGNPNWLGNIVRDMKADWRKAGARALNRTAAGARTVGVRAIAANLGLNQSAIREAMVIRQATASNLEAAVVATSRRIPLIEFNARQTRKGVTYRIGKVRKLLAGAFIATMRSGHEGIFKRRGSSRLPIDERFGPSIPLVFVRKTIQDAMKQVIEERLEREMQHQIDFYMRRAA